MGGNRSDTTTGENSKDGGAQGGSEQPSPAGGGEDDRSTEVEGEGSHLHDDQKSRPLGG